MQSRMEGLRGGQGSIISTSHTCTALLSHHVTVDAELPQRNQPRRFFTHDKRTLIIRVYVPALVKELREVIICCNNVSNMNQAFLVSEELPKPPRQQQEALRGGGPGG